LRATSPIIDSVLQTAKQYGVPLVHTIDLLDQRDWQRRRRPDGIADPEAFVDHVHPTIAAHQAIAAEIFGKLASLKWFEPNRQTHSRYESLVEEHLRTLEEDYYARGKQRLEGLRLWASGRASRLGFSED
jgi:hypothetical protein